MRIFYMCGPKFEPVSVGHVALGLSTGDLELYCRTKSEHVTLLWRKVKLSSFPARCLCIYPVSLLLSLCY